MFQRFAVFCPYLVVLAWATSSHAYQFINIANNTGPVVPSHRSFGAVSIAINSHGTVAFSGGYSGRGAGVFTVDGGPISTIVDNSGPFASFRAQRPDLWRICSGQRNHIYQEELEDG